MFKLLNNRTPDHIPSEFPTCPWCQSQSVFADEFPHLEIINNLLHEEHGTGQTLLSNSGFPSLNDGSSHHRTAHFNHPNDIGSYKTMRPRKKLTVIALFLDA
ncbi:hypothetical protein BC332_06913 [Capsicum chinense]|nr:hypothetical protein BC332_06913 [Capsicum chinense]